MLKRLLVILILTFSAPPALGDEATVRDRIVSELRRDGYAEIRISRTLLGRMRFVATSSDSRREIVVSPITGVILRDYVRFFTRSESGSGRSGGSGGGGDDDENDFDDENEDDENDEDDEDDDDDDDDDEDNSGSGSSSSGSSGSDDESDDHD